MELLEYKPDLIPVEFCELSPAVLCNIPAVKDNLTVRRLIHAAYNVHHCAFARARRSHDRYPFALVYAQVYIVKCIKASVSF